MLPTSLRKNFRLCQEFLEDLGWHLLSQQSVERLRVVGSGKASRPSSFTLLGGKIPCPTFPVMSAKSIHYKKALSPQFFSPSTNHNITTCNTMLSSLQTFSPSTFSKYCTHTPRNTNVSYVGKPAMQRSNKGGEGDDESLTTSNFFGVQEMMFWESLCEN